MSSAACDVLSYRDFGHFHERYYLRNRPVVIRGIREARPFKIYDWSADYFAHVMGDKVVPVLTTTTGFLSYERNVTPMKFAEFVARSFGKNPDSDIRYYFKNPTTLLPQGHDDTDQIAGLASYIAKAVTGNLWISGSGLTVGLHFDAAENFNFQLRGRKAFWLYPPGVRSYYPLPMFSQTAHISGVFRNGLNPDLSVFPRFAPSKGMRVELEAGDVLYLPAYWWHQVESLGDENVNLNFWWIPALRKQLPNWNQALRGHFQLAIRLLKFGNIQKAPAESPRGSS
jgi:hypothetical protein